MLTRAVEPPPARPWHLSRESIEPVGVGEFIDVLCETHGVSGQGVAGVREALGDVGQVVVHAYTGGQEPGDGPTRSVEVLVCNRVVWNDELPRRLPGHRLRVHLPPTSPSALDQRLHVEGKDRTLAELVARTAVSFAGRSIHALGAAARQAREQAKARWDFLVEEAIAERQVHGVLGLPARADRQAQVTLIGRIGGEQRTWHDEASEVGVDVGGWLVVDEAVFEKFDELIGLIGGCALRLVERLASSLAHVDQPPRRLRATMLLLDFAAAKLELRRDQADTLTWQVGDPLARRILELPVFPSTRGTAASGLWLVRRWCAEQGLGGEELFELAEDAPAELRAWLRETLHATATADAPLQRKALVPTSSADLPACLERCLDALRPDQSSVAMSVQMTSRALEDEARSVCSVTSAHKVALNPAHELVRRAASEFSAEAVAWLLLAVYAQINREVDAVSNDDEMRFSADLADALAEAEADAPDVVETADVAHGLNLCERRS